MEYKSIWELNDINENPKLNNDLEVDVVIVGGGIAGISTAYYLRNSNKKIILLEKDKVGNGVSKFTTGKLTYLQNGIYPNIIKDRSKSDALEYFNSQKEAIKLAKEIIYKHQIDCNLTPVASYLFAYNDTKSFNEEKELLDDTIEQLIQERNEARKNKNFKRSDEIRDLLKEQGIIWEDTAQGTRWKRND